MSSQRIAIAGSFLSDPQLLGNVAIDYDFSDPSTLNQAIGGGGAAVTNGDPIGRALDQSGNGWDIDAPANGQRPIWQSNVNGTAGAALFDGSNDQLERLTVSNVSAARSAFSVYAVVKHVAAPTTRESYLLFTTGANTTARLEHGASLASADRLRIVARRANADSPVTINGTIAVGTTMAIGTAIVNYAADTMDLYTNQQLAASGVPPGTSGANTQNTNGRIYVGGAGSGYLNAHYFRLIVFWEAHGPERRRAVWNYLRRTYQF